MGLQFDLAMDVSYGVEQQEPLIGYEISYFIQFASEKLIAVLAHFTERRNGIYWGGRE